MSVLCLFLFLDTKVNLKSASPDSLLNLTLSKEPKQTLWLHAAFYCPVYLLPCSLTQHNFIYLPLTLSFSNCRRGDHWLTCPTDILYQTWINLVSRIFFLSVFKFFHGRDLGPTKRTISFKATGQCFLYHQLSYLKKNLHHLNKELVSPKYFPTMF